MAETPAAQGRNYSPQLADAVEAWHVAAGTPNEVTSADLGVAVHRFARSLSLDTAEAMKIVRETAEAEITAKAAEQEAPAPPPEDARKAAWARLVKAYRGSKAEPGEAASAELGGASYAYGQLTGQTAEEAARGVRTAVWRKDVSPRLFYVSYMSGAGRFGGLAVLINRPMEDMRDVMETQAELIKSGDLPRESVIMGWSLFDQP